MTTISNVTAGQPKTMLTHGEALVAGNTRFSHELYNMDRAVNTVQAHWQGDAATAAAARALADGLAGTHISSAVTALAEAHTDGGKALTDIKKALLKVQADAVAAGMTVAADGTCTAPKFPTAAAGDVLAIMMQIGLDRQATVFTAPLKELLAQAGAAEAVAAAAIAKAQGDLGALAADPYGGGASTAVSNIINGKTALPTDPRQLHDLWSTLSLADKDRLHDWDPMIGNRDGVPQIDRDHYNRQTLDVLQTHAASAQGTVHQLAGQHPDWASGKNIPGVPSANASHHVKDVYADYTMWQRNYDKAKDEAKYLSGYRDVSDQIANKGDRPPRYLSLLDDKGHAAIAIENPDTADNVATFVPGTGARLDTIHDGVNRSQTMFDAAQAADRTKTPSVVTWYGYDAPQNPLTQSPSTSYAVGAAAPLDGFQDGLRVTHDGALSTNTVIGHSYGTTVIGHAASDGHTLNADQVVFVASPGVGVDNVSDLSLTGIDASTNGDHIYATTNIYDIIRETPPPVHDIQPVNPDFGAQVFDASDKRGPWWSPGGIAWSGEGSHGGYWDDTNPARERFGKIIAGRGVS